MKRREFITLLGGAGASAAALPLPARAQQSAMPVIGFLSSVASGPSAHMVAALNQGLGEAGFVEGRNIAIEYRWAEGQYDRLPALAAELVRRKVSVIVAAGGDRPTLAAKSATSTIPIVFTGSDFPVKIGLVASLNRPGGNVTGMSLFTSELELKKFALLRGLAPNIPLIAVMVNPNNPSAETDIKDLQKAADAVAQKILILKAGSEQEVDAAFDLIIRQHGNALLVAHDPFFNSRREQLIGLAARHRLAAMYEFREFVVAGGLMSYGSRITDNYRGAGVYAGRILKGEKPASLPVQQPTKLELVINLKTARTLGLSIPDKMLALADEVIE